MRQRAVLGAGGETLTDTLHIILASLDVLLILFIIGFGTTAFGKRFRLYSIGTILIVLVFGALAGLDGPRISTIRETALQIRELRGEFGQPNPLVERFLHYCSLRGPNIPGEPKLAIAFWDKIEKGDFDKP